MLYAPTWTVPAVARKKINTPKQCISYYEYINVTTVSTYSLIYYLLTRKIKTTCNN